MVEWRGVQMRRHLICRMWINKYLSRVRLSQSDNDICMCTCLQVICEKVEYLNQDSEQNILINAESQTESTHGSQRTVNLFPNRIRGSPAYSDTPSWRNPQTHLVKIYLVKEICLGVRRSYVRTRFCVSIGLHFHPHWLSWRPTTEKMVVTSEVPPDPAFLGFAEDSVI